MRAKFKKPLHLHEPVTETTIDGLGITLPDDQPGTLGFSVGPLPGKRVSVELTKDERKAIEAIVQRGLDDLTK